MSWMEFKSAYYACPHLVQYSLKLWNKFGTLKSSHGLKAVISVFPFESQLNKEYHNIVISS